MWLLGGCLSKPWFWLSLEPRRRDGKPGEVSRGKQDKEVQKGKVSSSLEMATEPERHDGAAISEAAVHGDRVSHAGAAPGREEDGDCRE